MNHAIETAQHPAVTGAGGFDEETAAALRALADKRRKRRRNRVVKIVVAVAIVIAALAVWHVASTSAQPAAEEPPVQTACATLEDFQESIQADGSLRAASSKDVEPEVDGTVSEVLVEEGQQVRKGDTLFVIDSPEIDKAIDDAADGVTDAQKAVTSAEKSLSQARAAYAQAKKDHSAAAKKEKKQKAKAEKAGKAAYQRAYDKAIADIPADVTKAERKKLASEAKEAGDEAYAEAYGKVEVVPAGDFDEASFEQEIESARDAVDSANDDLAKAQKTHAEAVADRDKCTVRSPLKGTVLTLNAKEGASTAGEGDPTAAAQPLAVIADLSKMKVNVEVSEADIAAVEKGQRALIGFTAFPELELEGKVKKIATSASGSGDDYGGGVTFQVSIVIDQPDERLKPGMTASAQILTTDIPDALVIPAEAVNEDEEGAYVDLVTDPETYATERRSVKVKLQSASEAVISSGLQEGDEVLIGGIASDAGGEGASDGDMGDDLGGEGTEGVGGGEGVPVEGDVAYSVDEAAEA